LCRLRELLNCLATAADNTLDMTGGMGTSQEGAFSVGEMLGDTSATITNLAMGDGAVKVDGKYTWTSQGQGDPGEWDPSADVQAWLGDSAEIVTPASNSSFYATASAGTLPTIQTSPITIDFAASQVWDCSDDVANGS